MDIRRQTPYGSPRGSNPTWANAKGFVGGDNDPTNLVNIGARQYDQTLGRFISVDPVMDLSSPQQWNAYSYASNSPITRSDPSGLIDTDCLEMSSCPDYRMGDEKGNARNKASSNKANSKPCWPRCSGSKPISKKGSGPKIKFSGAFAPCANPFVCVGPAPAPVAVADTLPTGQWMCLAKNASTDHRRCNAPPSPSAAMFTHTSKAETTTVVHLPSASFWVLQKLSI
ncbi:RHS repeat-associated core domain-containing protein [Micromonospora sp. NPDC047644]|uniref:RHS repeat-associated core domain-containing protein n=1 Tax=Micromonospora sp. NPDC047644 TaxID=3157203 RepID=UPI00345476EA